MTPDDVGRELAGASEKHPGDTVAAIVLRAGISVVLPWLSAPMEILISHRASEIERKRISAFAESLKRELVNLDEAKIDHDYLLTEEFYDLIVKALDHIRKTRSEKKRTLYARILRSGISSAATDTETSEDLMNIVTELTEREVDLPPETRPLLE